jgi:hypothetical protein
VETIDGPRLLNVEGLARRDLPVGVNQQHTRHAFAARKRMRSRAGDVSGADDANGGHKCVSYSSGRHESTYR